jgi:hypothetical protein
MTWAVSPLTTNLAPKLEYADRETCWMGCHVMRQPELSACADNQKMGDARRGMKRKRRKPRTEMTGFRFTGVALTVTRKCTSDRE